MALSPSVMNDIISLDQNARIIQKLVSLGLEKKHNKRISVLRLSVPLDHSPGKTIKRPKNAANLNTFTPMIKKWTPQKLAM